MSVKMMQRAMQFPGSYDSSKDPYWKEIAEGETRACLCFREKGHVDRGCLEICQFSGDDDYEVEGNWFKRLGDDPARLPAYRKPAPARPWWKFWK